MSKTIVFLLQNLCVGTATLTFSLQIPSHFSLISSRFAEGDVQWDIVLNVSFVS